MGAFVTSTHIEPVPSGAERQCVIYARISQDREGAGLGAKRQLEDCRELADQLGWEVIAEYVDNDVSAYEGGKRRKKKREDYAKMCEFLRSTPKDPPLGILSWHTDRMYRGNRELEDLIDLVNAGDHPVETCKAGPIDLRTPSGRMVARQLGTLAGYESEHKGERLERKFQEIASDGRFHGGARPFGYEGDGITVRESEAGWVRWAYEQKASGATNHHIIDAMNAAGMRTTTRGRKWESSNLTRMLKNPRYKGKVAHNGVIVRDAVWPALVTEETWNDAVAAVKAHRRPNHDGRRKFFVAGKVYCGREVCGAKMVTHPIRGVPSLWCRSSGPYYGCGKIRVSMARVSEIAEGYVLGKLADPDLLRGLAAAEEALDLESRSIATAIEDDERRVVMLQSALDDGGEDELPEVIASIRRLKSRIESNRKALARRHGSPVLGEINPETVYTDWHSPDFGVDRKHELLDVFVDHIKVYPALPNGERTGYITFDPRRVDIIPR